MAEPPSRDDDWVQEVVRRARASIGRGDKGELKGAKELAEAHGYRFRLRDDDVLVLHPQDWLDGDGVLQEDVDTSEALEIQLGDSGGAEEARDRNTEILEQVEEVVEDPDVFFNVEQFMEYCENHHGVAVDEVTRKQLETFLVDYYPRNVWASEEQEDALERSLEKLFELVDRTDVVEELSSL